MKNLAKKILFLGFVWPEKVSSAAGIRTECLIETFQSGGYEVFFASAAKNTDFEIRMQNLGAQTYKAVLNDSSFDEWIADLKPDAVIFDRFVIEEQFGWRVRNACPAALRIVDSIDLHFLRTSRQNAFPLENDNTWRELASFLRSDLTYVISDVEALLLKDQFQFADDLLQVLRFYYPDPQETPSFELRENFCTIGNFRHPPNYEAAFTLKEKIWPGIRKQLPKAEVHLYGAYPPKEIMALHDPSTGFLVKGWIEEPLVVLKGYRVNLAPLRFGAGIKGKISDGWYCGTPAVTTPVGAEGMAGGFPFGGRVCEDDTSFIQSALLLHENKSEWQTAHHDALKVMHERFNKKIIQDETLERFQKTFENKDLLRKNNWLGSLLWHQGNRATEYFGRWLEAKGKLQSRPPA